MRVASLVFLCLFSGQGISQDLFSKKQNQSFSQIDAKMTADAKVMDFEVVDFDVSQLSHKTVPIQFLDLDLIFTTRGGNNAISEALVWSGTVGDDHATISVLNNDVQGQIQTNSGIYTIRTIEGQVVVAKVDQSLFPEEACFFESDDREQFIPNSPDPGPIGKDPVFRFGSSTLDPPAYECKIRLLIAYTVGAKNRVSNIDNTISLAMQLLNQSFLNTNLTTEFELVHTEEVSYVEIDWWDDLIALTNSSDGKMDQLHTLRANYGADIVVLLTKELFEENNPNTVYDNQYFCGAARGIKNCWDKVFCTVDIGCATTNYTLAHEIGHLVGARHDIQSDGTMSPFDYAHGQIRPNYGYRTIMATSQHCPNGCTRDNIWSSKTKIHQGIATGIQDVAELDRMWVSHTPNTMVLRPLTSPKLVMQSDMPSVMSHPEVKRLIFSNNSMGTNLSTIPPLGSSWTFAAEKEISMNDGFRVESTTEFRAYNVPICGSLLELDCNQHLGSNDNQDLEEIQKKGAFQDFSGLHIYPNPSSSRELNVDLGSGLTGILVIRDVFGQVVFQEMIFASKQIKLPKELKAGTYFASMSEQQTLKLILE